MEVGSIVNYSWLIHSCILQGLKLILFQEICISYGCTYPYYGKKLRLAKMLRYDFVCSCRACDNEWPKWNLMPTGLVPEEVFDSGRWKEEDKLRVDMLARPLKAPKDFFTSLCLLQEKEREAKSPRGAADFGSLVRIYNERSEVMRVIKHPHFCHHKTKLSLLALFWSMTLPIARIIWMEIEYQSI